MADLDFEPPSFSLGFDLDLGSEPQSDPPSQPAKRPSSSIKPNLQTIKEEEEEDDDFESPVRGIQSSVLDPPRALKRLRHGPAAQKKAKESRGEPDFIDVEDEIEDLSSEEDWPRGNPSTQSVCSSSKSSLHSRRVLTSQCTSHSKSRIKKDISSTLNSSKNESNISRGLIFPKLTVSPLRKFQLVDSDSDLDEPSISEDIKKEARRVNTSSKDTHLNSTKSADLWQDFCPEKSFRIPTPAFDEICNEYFTSAKNNKVADKTNFGNFDDGKKKDMGSFPPSNRYFLHEDSRIRKLVTDRLSNFFPLGAAQNQEYRQQNATVIDYIGQFGHEENSTQSGKRINGEASSSRTKKNVKKSKVDTSQDNDNWVTPRSGGGISKDAGKRRVQAASKSAGHWFTGSDGKKVYVNGNGQELTGKMAYMNYRKESGKGYRTSKKKAASKKKPAPKKK